MRYLFLFIYLLISTLSTVVYSKVGDDYVNRAKTMGLAESPAWLALLHYKKEILSSRFQSQADDAAFFLAENGKTNPAAELESDILAFLKPSHAGHAQCLFPARWYWLKQQLNIADEQHDVKCHKLESWLQRAKSDELTLVFPSMFLNNPGSMFGHTFLRFDHSDKPELLSYTLNYAAKSDPSDSFLSYAFKGLSGGYRGVFMTRPYYETVQLYSDIENRDIWEYKLNVTSDEIAQLLRHVWEVTDIKFDYYFFSENCSYRLLALLDAVKPESRLSANSTFPIYVIPVDTVRAVDDAGLILSRTFRPSLATQINQRQGLLSNELKKLAISLADENTTIEVAMNNLDNKEQRALVFDQAFNILQFRGQAESEYANAILSNRSHLPKNTKYNDKNIDTPVSPELGHESLQMSIGFGENLKGKSINLQLRPAFHDLLDNPTGYVSGAEINVLDTELSWLTKTENMQLERLRFFNVVSLSPLKQWHKPLSWEVDILLQRKPISMFDDTLVFITKAAMGVTKQWFDALFFIMGDIELNSSDQFQKGYATLLGVSAGVVYPIIFNNINVGQFKMKWHDSESFAGAELEQQTMSAAVNLTLETNLSLQFSHEKQTFEHFEIRKWNVMLKAYY